jgi:hemerythrin superfamily protein
MMIGKLSPSATRMIRMDHTHVLATFHKYRVDTPLAQKRALVNSICLALEVHAQIEEEIFYPAMRSVDPDLVDKSVPEHNEMRRLIGILREKDPADAAYDRTLMELMRDVMRHVADEETMLLPDAERVLGERLDELGARMMRRRMQLTAPRAREMAVNTARSFPGALLAVTGVLVIGAFVAARALTRPAPPALGIAALRKRLLPPARRVQSLTHKLAHAMR